MFFEQAGSPCDTTREVLVSDFARRRDEAPQSCTITIEWIVGQPQANFERTEADTFNSKVKHVLYLKKKNSFSRQTHDYVVSSVA